MADGITRIAVEGFKSISKRQSIDIAPLTILAGANSSGKSSIMQPLLMLKQTLDKSFDPGGLWIGGPNVKFDSDDQFRSRTDKSSHRPEISVEIFSQTQRFQTTFRRGAALMEIVEQVSSVNGKLQKLRPSMGERELRAALTASSRTGKLSVMRDRFILNVGVDSFPVTTQWVEPFLRKMIHVPGQRGNPERYYPVAAIGPSFPGTFEYYVGSLVLHWQSQEPETHRALNCDLEKLGIAQRVRANKLNDATIELRVSRLAVGKSDDMVSVADVGLGVSHVLPIAVALRAADRGQLTFIEQPEIHLHPRAQVKLAEVLADAAKRGVRIVAETHSSLLLRAIQTLVAKGTLDPDLVRLHWFTRNKVGVTQIKSVVPDENGAFGDWPEDFGDVELQSEKDYLDAVESKLAR